MNNIEFRLLREKLHLSQTEYSEASGVILRTVQRWERGDFKVREDYARQLLGWDAEIELAAKSFERKLVDSRKNHGKPEEIRLLAYKPYDYDGDMKHYKLHQCLLERCQSRARNMQYPVRIILFDKRAYSDWLVGKDTQAKRAEWAAFQP